MCKSRWTQHTIRCAALQIEELEHEVAEARMEAKRLVAEARREAAEAQARAESEVRAGTLRIDISHSVGSEGLPGHDGCVA